MLPVADILCGIVDPIPIQGPRLNLVLKVCKIKLQKIMNWSIQIRKKIYRICTKFTGLFKFWHLHQNSENMGPKIYQQKIYQKQHLKRNVYEEKLCKMQQKGRMKEWKSLGSSLPSWSLIPIIRSNTSMDSATYCTWLYFLESMKKCVHVLDFHRNMR